MPGETNRPDEAPTAGEVVDDGKVASKSSYSGLRADINEADITSLPAAKLVLKMLIGEVRRCNGDIEELRDYKDRYHVSSQSEAVLNERLKGISETIGVRMLFFTAGGFLLGLLPYVYGTHLFWPAATCALASLLLALFNPKWMQKGNKI